MRGFRSHRSGRIARASGMGAAVIAVLLSLAAAPAAAQGQTCPGTFRVLHNDRIGSFTLPAGPYRITTSGGLSCSQASKLFAEFLQDYDGRLRSPWRLIASQSRFVRGSGSQGFTVAEVTGGGSHPAGGALCPGTFSITGVARVGDIRFARGNYELSVLGSTLTCDEAAVLLQAFLADDDEQLPVPWTFDVATMTFQRGSFGTAIRMQLVGTATGGGGTSGSGAVCPSTFRVLHNDRIGRLRLPRGRYYVTVFGDISCAAASRRLAQFLQRPSGRLPSGWRLDATNATFSSTRKRGTAFRVDRGSL